MFGVQHGYPISHEFALTYVLSGAFSGSLFLNIQWPPSHQACAKSCWPDTFPIQMPSLPIHRHHQALDGISPKLIIWRSVGGLLVGFFLANILIWKLYIRAKMKEPYNEYCMPTTSILPLTQICVALSQIYPSISSSITLSYFCRCYLVNPSPSIQVQIWSGDYFQNSHAPPPEILT